MKSADRRPEETVFTFLGSLRGNVSLFERIDLRIAVALVLFLAITSLAFQIMPSLAMPLVELLTINSPVALAMLFCGSLILIALLSALNARWGTRQAKGRQRFGYPRFESLEDRVLLSSVSWVSTNSGSWQTGSNWSSGSVPKPGDDVTINKAGIVVTLNGSTSVNSITLTGDGLTLATGVLTVTGGVTNNGGSITELPGTSLNLGGQYSQNANGNLTLQTGTPGTGVGTNLLANSGFESPVINNSNTAPGTWGWWGTSYLSNQYAQSGNQSLKTNGQLSGANENFAATPGVSYTGSIYAMTPAANPLTGSQGAFLEVMFFDAQNHLISSYTPPNDITVLDSHSATGGPIAGSVGNQGWNFFTTTAVAPSNAAVVSFGLNVGPYTGLPGTAGGDVYWDNAQFGPTRINAATVNAASVVNNGTMTVGGGDSINTTGAFTQSATGRLDVQLAGPAAGNLFGAVNVGGTANLGGKLQADLVNGYSPTLGDGFNVMTYAAETGMFATKILPAGTGYVFASAVNPTYLGLSAIPPSVTTTINASAPIQTLSTNMLGVNLGYSDSILTTSQTQQLVQAAGLDAFRFPGGSATDDYHFNVQNNFSSGSNSIPTFVQFITRVGGTGIVTLDYGSGSPQEAAAELAYLEGSPTDKTVIGTGIEWNDSTSQWQNVNWQTVGYWASLRGAAPLATDDGLNFMRISHPATFPNINLWEVGNQEYGSWEIDHHGTNGPGNVSTGSQHDPATYAAFAKTFATFAAHIDPSISIGIDSEDPTGAADNNWTKNVLTAGFSIGFVPGFISDQNYMQAPGTESDSILLQNTDSDPNSIHDWSVRHTVYETMLQQTVGSESSSVQIMAAEFSSVYANPGKQSTSLVNGLFVADSIGSLFDSDYTGGFVLDLRSGWDPNQNNSPSLYGWREGGDFGLLGDPGTNQPPSTGPYVPYPSYFAEQLASKIVQKGSVVVSASTNYNGLTTYAVKEPNGHLEILAINKNPDAAIADQFSLQGYQTNGSAQVWQYGEVQDHAQSLTSNGASSLANYSAALPVANNSFTFTFPAYSMTVLDLSPALNNKLVFTQQPPAAGTAGTALKSTVKISIEDMQGHVTPDSTTVTLTIGTSAYTATASAGVATFNISNLIFTKTGNYTWTATDGKYTKATSNLVVSPGAAHQLSITAVPSSGTAGVVLGSALKVSVLDQFGNMVATDSSKVSLSIGSGPGVFANTSTLTATVVNGVATFSKLVLDTSGAYTIKATDGTLSSAVSDKVTISAAVATHLVVESAPTSATAGLVFAPVKILVEDQFNNLVSTTSSVTLTLNGGKFSNGLTAITATTVAGVATFSSLMINVAGPYTLKVSDGAFKSLSLNVTVNPAVAHKLIFQKSPPASETAGMGINTSVIVTVEDTYGNVVKTDSSIVTLVVGSISMTATAVNGVAKFDISGVSISKVGNYKWIASDGSLAKATSNMAVTPAAANKMVIT